MIYAAIKLFLENGYEQTTTVAIAQAAGMSSSAFFAVFANKAALLLKLTKWMYEKQYAITDQLLGEGYEPEMFYAVEPSIQIYIHQMATDKLMGLFGAMHPQYTRQDFYELELATSGMVRSFMARKCDRNFTMEQKLRRFLSCSMTIYGVPEEKQQQVIDRVLEMDLKSVADQLVADAIHQADEQYQEAERKGKAIEAARNG